ncbi:hypothetical protein [Streptomyces sp. NPDC088135]|uniref:hypothetical protein n=1 Tax=Streptomyces sp. NPDC088135 TaxID=3160993 RepID=UPI0034165222
MSEASPTQDDAWRNGAVRIPDDITAEICESTNQGRPTGWPEFYDRHGEIWWETSERHDTDAVMLPGSNWEPMLRRDVQAEYGPLVTSEQYDEYVSALNRRAALAYVANVTTTQQ